MTTFTDSRIIEFYSNGAWVDVSAYVISDLSLEWGIDGNTPLDRVANIGEFKLTLNNTSAIFTPGSGFTLTGFSRGMKARLRTPFRGQNIVKFYGVIDEITPVSGLGNDQTVGITVLDWLTYAARYQLQTAQPILNYTSDAVVANAYAQMPSALRPLNYVYNTGDVFLTALDDTTANSTVYSEIIKSTLSEYGYCYLRHGGTDGETLVFEIRGDRNSGVTYQRLPVSGSESFLKLATGNYLKLIGGGKLLLTQTTDAVLSDTIEGIEIDEGKNLLNKVSTKAYPRKIDTTNKVLFTLRYPIQVASTTTISGYRAYYVDPDGGGTRVNAQVSSMVAPVATTDYLFYQNSDGTGTNLTANLVVTATYGSESIEYTFQNTGGTDGYITFLQARGKGIYLYEPVEYNTKDQTSIDTYGNFDLLISQKYQNDPTVSTFLADSILDQNKDPRRILESISFTANRDNFLMGLFLFGDIGSLINVQDSITGINSDYFIQKIEAIISVSGIITCKIHVVEALSLDVVYWELETAGKSELGTTTIVGV